MKWGVRKQQETSGRKRGSGQTSTQQNKAKATNRGRKTAAIALAAIGGTALASYGAYKLTKSRDLVSHILSKSDGINRIPIHRINVDHVDIPRVKINRAKPR